jgi:2-polyprenyl-3-methyl-5-hydroxy-6-metoxy-1,4-benzoquinol methylase
LADTLYERRVTKLPAAPPVAIAEACPACGAHDARPRLSIEGFPMRLVVCEGCGCGRLDPMPSDDEIAGLYPDAYYGEPGKAKFSAPVERLVRITGARHLRSLLSGVASGGRVLDVGCGRGVLLRVAAQAGFEAHGVEVSAAAAKGADAFAQIRIARRLSDAAYPEGFFDAVIVWHVLEHLRDPRATLREIHRVLRPGGRLAVAVPNFASAQARWAGADWFHLDLPRHLHHFRLDGLERMLDSCGFAVESAHHFSLRQNPFGWIQSASNRVRPLPRNGLYTLLHHRDPTVPPPFTPAVRGALLLLGALLAPLALAASALEAVARSGATVHVIARRR